MINSLKKNKKGILLIVISSIFACIGQLFWKLSYAENILYIIIGFSLYAVGAMTLVIAYKYGSLSVLQPCLSINYVFSTIIAFLILHEPLSYVKIIGIIIIIFGVINIGGSND